MASGSDVITIEILGARLQLRGGDHPEDVRMAGEYVRQKVNELAAKAPTAPSLHLALLAAMNIADEYIKMSNQNPDVDLGEAIEKANEILAKIP